jgi:putative two-component system response regulator
MTRILIVDDDPAICRLLVRMTEQTGYPAMIAAQADEALHAIEHNRDIGLVLADVALPGMSGIDLARVVTRTHPDVAVVMVSGIDDPETARLALENGANGYVLKPFRPTEIQIVVMNTLARRRLEIENRRHRERLEELVSERTGELRRTLELLSSSNRNLMRAQEEIIRRLSIASEIRDEETGAHILRMSAYSALLAEEVGLGAQEVELIRVASPLHDVGKIGIPDRILRKPGKHTPAEFEIMKQHTVIGHRTLSGTGYALLDTAATIALCHHERWDGSGYPEGLAGERIPMAGRIVAIADVFDALTTRRIYKPAFTLEHSLELMRASSGTHFDPELFAAFLRRIDDILAIRSRFPDEQLAAPTPEAVSADA